LKYLQRVPLLPASLCTKDHELSIPVIDYPSRFHIEVIDRRKLVAVCRLFIRFHSRQLIIITQTPRCIFKNSIYCFEVQVFVG
jgi:hypothetical protein